LVESSQSLEKAEREWRTCPVLGLDTEFLRERTYRADLGLVQVSDGTTAWLVDPVVIDDLSPLKAVLEDPSIEMVIHSGSEDFEVIYHQLGVTPQGVVDSQIACAMLGQSLQLGYHHAVNWLFGIEIEKDHTRSNWLRRPLSAGQLRYAALDVVLLPSMMERLRAELERLDRWDWLLEEVRRMARKSIQDIAPDSAWMRIGGVGSLDDSERKVIAALAAWRETTAIKRNIARGFVISDAGLLALARMQPGSEAELNEITDLHPRAIQRYGRVWLTLIRQAPSMPHLPPLPQLTPRQRRWLKSMRQEIAEIAGSLGVDAALLASRKQLEQFIIQYSETGQVPERFTGWRQEVITSQLLKI
ncbi:MAG: ribonuclease D, partial [Anaerolineae bacterium]|nr:ribonuclease D [Anaerolineae bacterium]